jgi:hypothetical protein
MLYISQYILAKLSYVLAEHRSSKVSGMYMHERAAQLNQLDLELSETIVMLHHPFTCPWANSTAIVGQLVDGRRVTNMPYVVQG